MLKKQFSEFIYDIAKEYNTLIRNGKRKMIEYSILMFGAYGFYKLIKQVEKEEKIQKIYDKEFE